MSGSPSGVGGVGGWNSVGDPSPPGGMTLDDIQKKIDAIEDPQEKQRLQEILDRIKAGNGTEEDFKALAQALGISPQELQMATGQQPKVDPAMPTGG